MFAINKGIEMIKSNRKQQGMEKAFLSYSMKKNPPKQPKIIDHREITTYEHVAQTIKQNRKWRARKEEADEAARIYLNHRYKNGAALFDEFIAIENSPLGKALS